MIQHLQKDEINTIPFCYKEKTFRSKIVLITMAFDLIYDGKLGKINLDGFE